MEDENSMTRLREIREIQRAARELNNERDNLLRKCAAYYSQTQLALAAGITRQRVAQIIGQEAGTLAP